MFRLSKLAGLLLVVALLAGCADDSGQPTNQTAEPRLPEQEASTTGVIPLDMRNAITPLGEEVMPIGAWVAPPPGGVFGHNNPSYISSESYKLAKEAGLNMVYGLYERAEMKLADVMQALDFADEHGLKYMVSDAAIQAGADDPELMEQSLESYIHHPAYIGNLAIDEPATTYFESLGASHDNYKKLVPDKYFYVNLLPNYASVNQLFVDKMDETGGLPTAEQYKTYLDQYVSAVKPTFISYDYYPLHDDFPSMTNGYYENMSVVRSTAENNGIPFWVFIQSSSWNSKARLPQKSETFWQVNTALAYGAKGIQYFTFWCPYEDGFTGGMISRDGERTPIYYDTQEMNEHIAAIDHILMRSGFKGVMVHGDSPVPVPEEDRLAEAYKELERLEGDTPIIAGVFDYNGSTVLYVVNNTIDQDGEVTLHFAEPVELELYQQTQKHHKAGQSLSLQLAAGEGVLIAIR